MKEAKSFPVKYSDYMDFEEPIDAILVINGDDDMGFTIRNASDDGSGVDYLVCCTGPDHPDFNEYGREVEKFQLRKGYALEAAESGVFDMDELSERQAELTGNGIGQGHSIAGPDTCPIG